MKRIFLSLITISFATLAAFADNKQEAINFFKSYVNAANTYSEKIPDMYSPNAKIIREVVKPDGTLVDVNTDTATYMKQLRLNRSIAKVRKYTNTYRNISAISVTKGYKVSAERQPKGETYWLKTYQIVQKQPDGKWKIIEEMMQTKEQIFLRYAK